MAPFMNGLMLPPSQGLPTQSTPPPCRTANEQHVLTHMKLGSSLRQAALCKGQGHGECAAAAREDGSPHAQCRSVFLLSQSPLAGTMCTVSGKDLSLTLGVLTRRK